MESEIKSSSRICPIPPDSKKGLNLYFRPSPIFMAVGLSFILITTGLAYYWMLPPPPLAPPPPSLHVGIAIDGDTNFSATALLEGWPGDGSPENPFIIDGLDIDLSNGTYHCIMIRNTQVSFIISNCNLTGSGSYSFWEGVILLYNVTNGELVNNTCFDDFVNGITLYNSHSNTLANNTCTSNIFGISLEESDLNTVTDNTCSSNTFNGILLDGSDHNIVDNNPCNSNGVGIGLGNSNDNTVANNICNNNTDYGIGLIESDFNTIADNTCNNNRIGIYLYVSESNTVENNTFLDNTEYDIVGESYAGELAHREYVARQFVWFLAGFGMILVVSVIAFVQFRRMEL